MPETVVLFHSAVGLTPSVHRFADALREDGHTVMTPDLYDGRTFQALQDGVAHRDALGGVPAMIERATAAVAGLPSEIVYVGFSMGAAAAEWFASGRPGARGAVLMHGAIPPAYLEVAAWPQVPVQIHYGTADPWATTEEIDAFRQFVQDSGVRCEVYPYEVPGHLFADEDGEDYNAAAAGAMLQRVREFLGTLGS